MKKYLLLLLFIPLVNCSDAVKKIEVKTDLEKQGFKGSVKSVENIFYGAKEEFGEVVVDKSDFSIYDKTDYNEFGNIIYREFIYSSKYESYNTYQKNYFKYDENNLKIEEEVFGYRTNGDDEDDEGKDYKFERKDEFKYDDLNNLKYINSIDDIGSKTIEEYIYNEDGKLIEVNKNNIKNVLGEEEMGDLTSKVKYSFKENREIKEEYKGDGSFEGATVTYFEDEIIKEAHYYDDSKEEISQISYYKDKWIFKFDSYSKGAIQFNYKYEYEFDSLGNPIKRINYTKNADEQIFRPQFITLWKIEYY